MRMKKMRISFSPTSTRTAATFIRGPGREDETGKGAARGSKLNVALKPGSGDAEFLQAWPRVEQHLAHFEPEFIVFQCGADGLKYDPPGRITRRPRLRMRRKACAPSLRGFEG